MNVRSTVFKQPQQKDPEKRWFVKPSLSKKFGARPKTAPKTEEFQTTPPLRKMESFGPTQERSTHLEPVVKPSQTRRIPVKPRETFQVPQVKSVPTKPQAPQTHSQASQKMLLRTKPRENRVPRKRIVKPVEKTFPIKPLETPVIPVKTPRMKIAPTKPRAAPVPRKHIAVEPRGAPVIPVQKPQRQPQRPIPRKTGNAAPVKRTRRYVVFYFSEFLFILLIFSGIFLIL